MAIVVETESTYDPIELAECLEKVSKTLVPEDQDSILSLAPVLKSLAANKRFLTDFLNGQLAKFMGGGKSSLYSPQSFILGGNGTTWTIRGNFWFPLAGAGTLASVQTSVFSYERPHNHNFSLLTVGWFGPGYETALWECDPASITGIPGEIVDLLSLGRESLPSGKVLFYRPFRDVHIQYSPQKFSISLNLLVVPDSYRLMDQYIFDVETSRIVGVPDDLDGARRGSVMELLGYFGDDRTKELLFDIATSHPCRRTRLGATRGLLLAGAGQAPKALETIASSSDDFLRHYSRVLSADTFSSNSD